jgi:hypothetical protein
MSRKTLRAFKDPAISPTTERSALLKTRVLACAVGLIMLAPATTFALELGEAAMKSGIGQSLLVQIPYRLAPNEQLTPACVGLAPAASLDNAFPTYARVSRIAITPTHIEIFGDSRVLEPLIGLNVDVHCDTAPRFVRSYELFVDPPSHIPAFLSGDSQFADARAGTATRGAAASIETIRAPRANVSARARGQTGAALAQGQTYVVVRGDTLSGIAARVGDRPATIRDAAEAIFAANNEAFARGNRDLLEAGRSITIPIMTAVAATRPATPAPLPSVHEAELPAAPPPLSAALPAAPTTETLPPGAEASDRVVVPEAFEPSAAAMTAAQPSAAPVSAPGYVPSEGASAATTGRARLWLTALLALGVVVVLSTPLLLVRRRKQAAVLQHGAKPRSSQPRPLVDPVAGFHVVEGQLTRAPASSKAQGSPPKRGPATPIEANVVAAAEPNPLTLGIGLTDSVDLDVGAPVIGEHVDWLEKRAAAPVLAHSAVTDATAPQQPLERDVDVSEPTIDDEKHTLTIVELDILRQDYEAEHTLTQEANQALRDAVADLRATQAARNASADAETGEMPQQSQTEATETQQTARLRSSR